MVNQSNSVMCMIWNNTPLLASVDRGVSVNDGVAAHPVAIISEPIVYVVAAHVRGTIVPEVVAIVIKCMIAETRYPIVNVVPIEVAIDYWDIPSTDVVAIIDVAAVDSVVTSV